MCAADEQTYSLGDIVARLGGEVVGDPAIRVRQVASLETAERQHISFFSAARFRKQLDATRAAAVIVGPAGRDATERARIVSENPYAYFAKVSALLNPPPAIVAGVHPAAVVDGSARVATSACIGPFAHIGAGVRIGERVVVGSGCAVGAESEIGDDSVLYARVVVYHRCRIGARVIVHSGAVIGADGFGLARVEGRWLKIPQIGRVVIGDDVEITTILWVD